MNQNIYNVAIRDRRFYRAYSFGAVFILFVIAPAVSVDRVVWGLCMIGILLDVLLTRSIEKDFIKMESLLNEIDELSGTQVDNG
jgi:hypothetical protein